MLVITGDILQKLNKTTSNLIHDSCYTTKKMNKGTTTILSQVIYYQKL